MTATCFPSITALNAARIATLRLPEADVAAQEPVHGLPVLHVALDLLQNFHLVGSLDIFEPVFELFLPDVVRGERVTCRAARFA